MVAVHVISVLVPVSVNPEVLRLADLERVLDDLLSELLDCLARIVLFAVLETQPHHDLKELVPD